MNIARSILEKELNDEIRTNMSDKNTARLYMYNMMTLMSSMYEYPTTKTVDILNKNLLLDILSPEELFWFCSASNPSLAEKAYTEKEIKKYSAMKYKAEEEKSIEISCVEVVKGEQWIGAVPDAAAFFTNLRKKQKIYYNPNAQRAMTMEKLKNGKTLWKITLSKTTLKKIRENYNQRKFIPNTITLNIDPDTDTKLEYEDGKLVISDLDHFDITDGFHRYMALCKEKDQDDNFSYPMEIRITRFPDDKASLFVWQEDQKTPMKKRESATLNTESIENKIARRLNDSDGCLRDNIGRNDSPISLADVVEAIKKVYVYPAEKQKTIYDKATFIKESAKEISRKWNAFVDEYPDTFKDGYNTDEIRKIIEASKEDKPIEWLQTEITMNRVS